MVHLTAPAECQPMLMVVPLVVWLKSRFVDWQITDPKHMEPAQFNEVRDFIKGKIQELLQEEGVL